jgi:polar amino acid transport system substrate-binding protein
MPTLLRLPLLILVLFCVAAPQTLAGTGDSALARIQERGQLVLGTSGNMPTMSQLDASGKLSGFDFDIARLMADAMGVKLVPKVLPFGELIPALEAGEVDVVISNMTITPQRNLRVAFVGPYMTSGKCIVTRSEALAKAKESPDLNTPATRIAALDGSTSEKFAKELFPQATVVTVDDYKAAAELVKGGKVTGMLSDYPICVATLKSNPDAGFVSLFSLLTYEPIGIALPAGDAQFINWTRNFLTRLDGTDTLKGLSKQWLGEIRVKR